MVVGQQQPANTLQCLHGGRKVCVRVFGPLRDDESRSAIQSRIGIPYSRIHTHFMLTLTRRRQRKKRQQQCVGCKDRSSQDPKTILVVQATATNCVCYIAHSAALFLIVLVTSEKIHRPTEIVALGLLLVGYHTTL